MSDTESKPQTRPTTGRNGPFTKGQNAVVEKSFPAWHQFSLVENFDCAGRGYHTKLTEWKKSEAKKLIKHQEFSTLPPGFDTKQTIDAIVRKFTNYRTSRKRAMEADRMGETEALKAAAAALVDLKTFCHGRSIFKKRNRDKIHKRRNEILANDPDNSPIGAYQTSLSELWGEANQDYWEECAKQEEKEIYENQDQFGKHLYASLRGLCQVGGLGNMELVTFYAFRNKDGHVNAGVMEAHHDDEVFNLSEESSSVEVFRSAFEDWAQRVLPNSIKKSARPSDYVIEQNSEGIPLFPSMNPEDESPSNLRRVLESFFEYVWAYCQSDSEDGCTSSIPWDNIADRPDDFFDTNLFELSAPLTHPSKLTKSQLWDLAGDMLRISGADSPAPFKFRTRCEEELSHPDENRAQFSPEVLPPPPTPKPSHTSFRTSSTHLQHSESRMNSPELPSTAPSHPFPLSSSPSGTSSQQIASPDSSSPSAQSQEPRTKSSQVANARRPSTPLSWSSSRLPSSQQQASPHSFSSKSTSSQDLSPTITPHTDNTMTSSSAAMEIDTPSTREGDPPAPKLDSFLRSEPLAHQSNSQVHRSPPPVESAKNPLAPSPTSPATESGSDLNSGLQSLVDTLAAACQSSTKNQQTAFQNPTAPPSQISSVPKGPPSLRTHRATEDAENSPPESNPRGSFGKKDRCEDHHRSITSSRTPSRSSIPVLLPVDTNSSSSVGSCEIQERPERSLTVPTPHEASGPSKQDDQRQNGGKKKTGKGTKKKATEKEKEVTTTRQRMLRRRGGEQSTASEGREARCLGVKRDHAEMMDGDRDELMEGYVILHDKRRGRFKKLPKYKGAWFFEEGYQFNNDEEGEWLNNLKGAKLMASME